MVYWESDRLRRYFYFVQDATDNFLESELGMQRGVSVSSTISIFGCQIREKVSACGVRFICLKCIGQLSSHKKKFFESHSQKIVHSNLKGQSHGHTVIFEGLKMAFRKKI